VLKEQQDVNVLVEGHTDDVPIARGTVGMQDNWDLSVLRATSVVRILQESSKIDPLRITAAGKSQYEPADPSNKAKNRRIEIILAPDLKELYDLVKEQ
jgi:chemotaxis protein MotB